MGARRIVLDLSCRFKNGRYWVVTDRWQKFSELAVDGATLEHLSSFCDEFLVHGVDVEGKQCGIDEDLIGILGDVSPLCVTYAGGVKDTVVTLTITPLPNQGPFFRRIWRECLLQERIELM